MKFRTKAELKARKRTTCAANQKSIMAATVDIYVTSGKDPGTSAENQTPGKQIFNPKYKS